MNVTIHVDKKTGKSEVRVSGVKGSSCLDITKMLRQVQEGYLKKTEEFDQVVEAVSLSSVEL